MVIAKMNKIVIWHLSGIKSSLNHARNSNWKANHHWILI